MELKKLHSQLPTLVISRNLKYNSFKILDNTSSPRNFIYLQTMPNCFIDDHSIHAALRHAEQKCIKNEMKMTTVARNMSTFLKINTSAVKYGHLDDTRPPLYRTS